MTHRLQVHAQVTFALRGSRRPRAYSFDPGTGGSRVEGSFETRGLSVLNGRQISRELSLDEHGVMLIDHDSAHQNFYDEQGIKQRYYREVENLVMRWTGGAEVVAFDHNVRILDGTRRGTSPVYGAVMRAHNDYTEKSAVQRLSGVAAERANLWKRSRFAIVNVWRAIREPLLRTPLAVCDASTVTGEDLVAADLIYPDRTGEIYYVAYSPRQRWLYFPRLMRREALLIKVYDSAHVKARFTPHVAFEDPDTPVDAPPRESIEVRTLIRYE